MLYGFYILVELFMLIVKERLFTAIAYKVKKKTNNTIHPDEQNKIINKKKAIQQNRQQKN